MRLFRGCDWALRRAQRAKGKATTSACSSHRLAFRSVRGGEVCPVENVRGGVGGWVEIIGMPGWRWSRSPRRSNPVPQEGGGLGLADRARDTQSSR